MDTESSDSFLAQPRGASKIRTEAGAMSSASQSKFTHMSPRFGSVMAAFAPANTAEPEQTPPNNVGNFVGSICLYELVVVRMAKN
jgi:hypothetical protein